MALGKSQARFPAAWKNDERAMEIHGQTMEFDSGKPLGPLNVSFVCDPRAALHHRLGD